MNSAKEHDGVVEDVKETRDRTVDVRTLPHDIRLKAEEKGIDLKNMTAEEIEDQFGVQLDVTGDSTATGNRGGNNGGDNHGGPGRADAPPEDRLNKDGSPDKRLAANDPRKNPEAAEELAEVGAKPPHGEHPLKEDPKFKSGNGKGRDDSTVQRGGSRQEQVAVTRVQVQGNIPVVLVFQDIEVRVERTGTGGIGVAVEKASQ